MSSALMLNRVERFLTSTSTLAMTEIWLFRRKCHETESVRSGAILACILGGLSNFIDISLGVVVRGFGRVSSAISLILLFIGALGLLGALSGRTRWLFLHYGLISGIVGITCLYIGIYALVSTSTAWLLFLVVIGLVIDSLVSLFTCRQGFAALEFDLKLGNEAKLSKLKDQHNAQEQELEMKLHDIAAAKEKEERNKEQEAERAISSSRKKKEEKKVPSPSAPEKPALSREQSTSECAVCMDATCSALLYPCGHIAVCYDCGKELQRQNQPCPMCRGFIKDVVKTFKS